MMNEWTIMRRACALLVLWLIGGSLGVSVAPVAAAAGPCPYEDQSSGLGGQHGACTWTCDGVGEIRLSVQADDPDASVSGDGECGDADVSCEGTKSCADTDGVADEGVGTCSGSSHETFDSGLRVTCSWQRIGDPPGGGQTCISIVCVPEEGLRPVSELPGLCGNQATVDPASASTNCPWPNSAGPSVAHERCDAPELQALCREPLVPNSVTIFMLDGQAWSVRCGAGSCVEVEPSCARGLREWTCRV